LYLALPGEYRIHGTDIDKIYGIGMQITHGCVRMYPENIEELYEMVSVGTPVYIVKQPIKVGWLDNVLYVEAHPDLEGEETTLDQRFAVALRLIQKANNTSRDGAYAASQPGAGAAQEMPDFDQKALNQALTELRGDPVAIYERLPALEGEPAAVPEQAPEPTPTPVVKQKASPAPVAKKKASTAPVTKHKASPKGYFSGN